MLWDLLKIKSVCHWIQRRISTDCQVCPCWSKGAIPGVGCHIQSFRCLPHPRVLSYMWKNSPPALPVETSTDHSSTDKTTNGLLTGQWWDQSCRIQSSSSAEKMRYAGKGKWDFWKPKGKRDQTTTLESDSAKSCKYHKWIQCDYRNQPVWQLRLT